jgi:predicted metal-dependent HD superfamily phosphohydrolase
MKKFLVLVLILSLVGLCILIASAFFVGDAEEEYLQERFWYLMGCAIPLGLSLIVLIARYSYSEEYYRQIDRWLALWYRLGAKWEWNKYDAFLDLLAHYNEPHRAYHVFAHIEHCLKEFDQVRYLARNPDAVEMGLWFHDVIEYPKAKDNVDQSANYWMMVANNAGLLVCFVARVVNLILATKHSVAPNDPDAQLLVDIDLSILGQPEEKFDEYERQIRKEYEWVPEEAYVDGRRAVLKAFFERPTIYSTEFFRNKYEKSARENLKRSLEKLSGT